MIIDCHCHAGTGDGLTGPWDTTAPLDAYMERASQADISRTVLFAVFHSDYAEANRRVARIAARYTPRFYCFAFVHAIRDRGRVGRMLAEAQRLGFCGIKVHQHDARISREICEAARVLRWPVLYDVMGETSTVEILAREYSDVSFIIPHLGSFADDWRAQTAFIGILERYANIYTDTSGVRRFDLLEEALHRAGAGKILFGSDGPWLHPGVELAKVRALHLSRADEARVLGGNLLRLLRHASPRIDARIAPLSTPHTQVAHELSAAAGTSSGDPWTGSAFIP